MMSILKRSAFALCVVALAFVNTSQADLLVKDGAGNSQTLFDFTCFTSKHCTAHVVINSAGTEIFTAAAPGQVTGANGTFPATQSGTWNINNISGTISLPTGAASAANQTNASQKTQLVDGSGNVIAATSNNLNVQCANCSGSGVSTADAASFTAGASLFAGTGGFFQTTATNNALTNGQQGMWQMTANRAGFVNLRNASGTEIGVAATPLQVGQATASNLNATVVGTGTFATQAAQSGTWNVTNISGTVSLPTGAATSANQTTWQSATAAAVPANAVYHGINVGGNLRGATGLGLGSHFSQTVAIVDASGNQITSFGGSGGTASNYGSAFPSSGTAIGFTDGTNMVAGRVGAVANVAAATNYLDTLAVCQYLATPPTLTDTRYNHCLMDINGSIRVNVTNTNVNVANNADAVAAGASAGSPVVNYGFVYNGTTWDRMPGTTAGVTVRSPTAANFLVTLPAETTKVIGTVRTLGNAGAIFDAATGAAPSANAVMMGALTSGATGGLVAIPVACDQNAFLNMTTATTTEIVALTSGRSIMVCSYSVTTNGTTAVKFVRGTGTNCGTGTADVTANDEWTAQTGITRGSGLGTLFRVTAANALCVVNGSAINAHINVTYSVI